MTQSSFVFDSDTLNKAYAESLNKPKIPKQYTIFPSKSHINLDSLIIDNLPLADHICQQNWALTKEGQPLVNHIEILAEQRLIRVMDKINLDKANKLRTCGKVKAVKTHAANVECNHYNKGEVWACNISLHDYDRQIKVDEYIAKAHYFQDLMVKEGKQSYISQGTILFEDDNIEAAVKSLQKLKILAQKHTEKCQQYEVINYFGYNPLTKLTIWSVELFVIADKTIATEVFKNFKMVNYRNYVWDGTVVMPSCIQRIMPRASDFPDDLSMERWLVMTNNSHFQSGHGFKAPSKAAKAEAPAMWVDENGKSHPVCPECGEPLTKTVLLTNAEYTLLETGRIGIKAFRFSTSKDDIMPRLGYQEIKETQKEGIPYYARDPVAV